VIRVLVCEDQELIRAGYAAALGAQPDMELVGEAADGVAALAAVRRTAPDVVVMDIQMPGMDGIEVTRRVAGPEAEHPTKVLIVTTFNVDSYVYEALRAGAAGFLLKDAPLDELVAGVRVVASGDSLLSPGVTRTLIGRHADRIRPRPQDDPLAELAPREREVLRLIANGLSNAEIAAELVLSVETVKTYVSRILTRLDLRDRVQAVVLAFRTGLVSPADEG
jgi:DNA-binding NarL/FixJ family response regulator